VTQSKYNTCTMTNAPNQDLIHRRLKAVMDRPENQSCCECGAHKPTWASIIVPPTSVPQEVSAQPMGALCCFHCSGAHRRLGVHICFVRSVTLDDCKCMAPLISDDICASRTANDISSKCNVLIIILRVINRERKGSYGYRSRWKQESESGI
jgi:hypothetical protein